jgi:hypothetical protein
LKTSFRSYVGDAQYLKKEDLSDPVDTELLWVKEEKVTAPGKGTKTRLVAYFEGLSKGLVLNTANCEKLAEMAGTDDPGEWKDVPLQLWVDPEVKYGGKKIGGIRIRPLGQAPVTKNALSNAIEASEEAFRLLKEAMIEEKDQKISARLAVFNKSSENRFKAECSYREELERRRTLIPLAVATEEARRGYNIILQRLNTLPGNLAARCNPADPTRAVNVLEAECTSILSDAQMVYASWSDDRAPASNWPQL